MVCKEGKTLDLSQDLKEVKTSLWICCGNRVPATGRACGCWQCARTQKATAAEVRKKVEGCEISVVRWPHYERLFACCCCKDFSFILSELANHWKALHREVTRSDVCGCCVDNRFRGKGENGEAS